MISGKDSDNSRAVVSFMLLSDIGHESSLSIPFNLTRELKPFPISSKHLLLPSTSLITDLAPRVHHPAHDHSGWLIPRCSDLGDLDPQARR